jgi:Fur family transcriptional regulator, ferric uptake regulator
MNDPLHILKKASLKATPLRKEVLNLISTSSHALDNQEIESKLGEVDRITLYRTLKSFEEKGIIHKVTDLSGVSKYAICDHICLDNHSHNHKAHIHFQCDICHNTYCVENVEIPHIKVPEKFTVSGQNITLTGNCDRCQ